MKQWNWKLGLALCLAASALLTGCGSSGAGETTAPLATIPPAAQAEAVPRMEAPTEAPTEVTSSYVAEIRPVTTGDQTQVTVTTPDEFLAAVAPDREIVVDAELLDWSKATGYGKTNGEYYSWSETFDGVELTITGVSNLTIRGAGDNTLSAVPRYANVLVFVNCEGLHIQDLTVGHTQEPGNCTGGVLAFRNCQDVLVENCGLFGCGTLGVIGENSKDMQIVNNEIYECSVGGVEFTSCDSVNVDGNTFRDLGGPIFRIYDSTNITRDGREAIPFQ